MDTITLLTAAAVVLAGCAALSGSRGGLERPAGSSRRSIARLPESTLCPVPGA